MEHQKILNLLNDAHDSYFVARKWNIANDLSNANYEVGNKIIFNTEVLKSISISDYNDPYISVKGEIIATTAPATQAFKNCVPFTTCITKIDGTAIGDAEDLDLVMPMYNPIEYSSNYSETAGSLWFYS